MEDGGNIPGEKLSQYARKIIQDEGFKEIEALDFGQPESSIKKQNLADILSAGQEALESTEEPVSAEPAAPDTTIPESVPFPTWLGSSANSPEPAETALPNPDPGRVIEPTTPETSSPQQYETWDEIIQRVRATDEAQHALEQNESAKTPEPAAPGAESGEKNSSEPTETALPDPNSEDWRNQFSNWLQPAGPTEAPREPSTPELRELTDEELADRIKIGPTIEQASLNLHRSDLSRVLSRAQSLKEASGDRILTFSQWKYADNQDNEFSTLPANERQDAQDVQIYWINRLLAAQILPEDPLIDHFRYIFGTSAENYVMDGLMNGLINLRNRGELSQNYEEYFDKWYTFFFGAPGTKLISDESQIPPEKRPGRLKNIEQAAIEIALRIDDVKFLGLRFTDFFAGMGVSWATRNIAKIALFSLTGGASIPTAALAGGAGGAISGATKEYLKQVRGNVREAHALELTPRKLKLKEKLKTLKPNNKGALVKATGTGLVAGMAGGIVGSYVLEHGGEWIDYLKHVGENRPSGAMAPITPTSTATELAPSPTKTPLIPLTETPTPKTSPTYTPSPKASPAEITSATPTKTAIPTGTATATSIASPTETALPTPPKEITPPAGGTPINSSRLEEVQQLFKDPYKNPAAAAVGAHLEVSSDIVNKALAESNIDPHSVSDEAREKMRLAVQHKMESWSNDNFEIMAKTAPPDESLNNILREARTQVDNSWDKTDVIKHLKAGAMQELANQNTITIPGPNIKDLLHQDIQIKSGSSFWQSLDIPKEYFPSGTSWVNSANGVTQSDVIKDMIAKFAAANGHNLSQIPPGTLSLNSLGLTEEQMWIINAASKTTNEDDYRKNIMPYFQAFLNKVPLKK